MSRRKVISVKRQQHRHQKQQCEEVAAAENDASHIGGSTHDQQPRRMIAEKELLALVPIGRATLYRLMQQKKFPRGTFVSPGLRLWFADEICAWQNSVNERNPNYGRGRPRHPKDDA